MRSVKMVDIIAKSFNRTGLILFQPFSVKKWIILLFIAFLAGSLFNFNGGSNYPGVNSGKSTIQEDTVSGDAVTKPPESKLAEKEAVASKAEIFSEAVEAIAESKVISYWAWLVAAGILLVIPLIILITWLRARFLFIWYNAIVNNAAIIVEPFGRFKVLGNSLFKLFLIIIGLGVLTLGISLSWGYLSALSSGVFEEGFNWSISSVFNMWLMPALILIASLVLLGIFNFFVEHFVVPIMAIDQDKFPAAGVKFWAIFKGNIKDFILCILLFIGLGIAGTIALFIVGIAMLITLLLIAAILFGIPFLIFFVLLKLKVVFFILAGLAGIPFVLMAFLILAMVSLPVSVFFRSFSLYFLSSLNCGYTPLALESPATPE